MTQQIMPLALGPDDSDDGIARAHAARNGWRFVRWEQASDLFGAAVPMAVFADARGRQVLRTIDALRLARG